jgi:hypothetical protein
MERLGLKYRGTTKMKHLLSSFLVGLLALQSAFAGNSLSRRITVESVEGRESPANLLFDPSFEHGALAWTASGGATTAVTTNTGSVDLPGKYSYDWDSNAASQTLLSRAVTVTSGAGVSGQGVTVSCRFKVASGTATHKIQLWDGTNVLNESTITSSTSGFVRTSVTGTAPASGSIYLRVISVASNEPEIFIDNCYLGTSDGFNWSQVSQATQYGFARWVGTTNCDWTTVSTSWGNFSADSDCTTPVGSSLGGFASAPATKVPGTTFASLPPGDYLVVASGSFRDITSDSNGCYFRLSDGTNFSGAGTAYNTTRNAFQTITGRFSYTAAQSNLTFQVQARSDNAANTCSVAAATVDDQELTIHVYRYPTVTEGTVRADQLPASWSGYHDGTCAWSLTTGSVGDPSADASCAFVERRNRNFGTVASVGGSNALPGITWTPAKAGRYLVMVTFTYRNSSGGGSGMQFKLVDGSANVLDWVVANGTGATFDQSAALMGILDAPSTAAVTAKIQFASNGSATTGINSAGTNVEWKVIALDQAMPQPIVPGTVFSSSTGTEHVERAHVGGAGSDASPTVCSSTPCTIYSQSGSWLSSVTRSATGVYTMNFTAGAFLTPPACVYSQGATGSYGQVNPSGTAATTSTSGLIARVQLTGAALDTDFYVICMGPH